MAEFLVSAAENSSNSTDVCHLDHNEWRDIIVIVKIVFSSLSIIGSLSIVISVLATCSAKKQMTHPLLAVAVADLLLAVVYVVGCSLWLARARGDNDSSLIHICLAISQFTLLLFNAALNHQLVYSVLAHLYIRKAVEGITLRSPLIATNEKPVMTCGQVTAAYTAAWVVPFVVVMTPYLGLSLRYSESYRSPSSCWCLPTPWNVVPYTSAEEGAALSYNRFLQRLNVATGVPLGVLTLVVAVAMIALYMRMWCYIRTTDKGLDLNHRTARNEKLREFIAKQRKSFRRIIAFMTYFNIVVILTLISFVVMVGLNAHNLLEGHRDYNPLKEFSIPVKIMFFLQAVICSSLGLINAIIFGWTRSTFREGLCMNSADHPSTSSHPPTPSTPRRQTSTSSRSREISPTSSVENSMFTVISNPVAGEESNL